MHWLLLVSALASPIGTWSLNGDLTDGVGGFDAAGVGMPTYTTGVAGSAVDLSGADGGLVAADPGIDLTSDLTISAWVRPESLAAMAVACRWGTSDSYADQRNWCLELEPDGNGDLRLVFRTSSSGNQGNSSFEDVVGSMAIEVGMWTHVAGSFQAGTTDTVRKLYVNGVVDTTDADTGVFELVGGSVPLSLGLRQYDPLAADRYYDGAIDEVILDDAMLDATAIDALFDLDDDGTGDHEDTDDDGDGVLDVDDLAPRNAVSCSDDDLDDCDDCAVTAHDTANDGSDADADGFCDIADPPVVAGTLLDTDDVSWTSGGIGAPTIVYDSESGLMVMVYETNTGTSPNCPVGAWALGLATSSDGRTWSDIGGALLSPTAGTFYSCVAAHPGLLDRAPGTLILFFKGEQGNDACDETTPSWGCNQYTGIGRATLTWNSGTSEYELTGPSTDPALVNGVNFGYPKGVYQNSKYHVTYSQYPDVYVASGTTALTTVTGPVWMAGDSTWADTELRSPSPMCDGSEPFQVHVEGDTTLGRLDGDALDNLTEGPGPLWDVAAGDPALRHHDALPLIGGGWFVIFDTLDGPGGTNQVRYAVSDESWAPSDLGSKACL